MKAIGGSDGDIRRIFLIEASAIVSLACCMRGAGLGLGVSSTSRQHIHPEPGGTPATFFPYLWLIGGAIGSLLRSA